MKLGTLHFKKIVQKLIKGNKKPYYDSIKIAPEWRKKFHKLIDMTLLMNSFYRMFSRKEDHFSMNTFNSKNRMRSKVHSFLEQFFCTIFSWQNLMVLADDFQATFSWHQLKVTPKWVNWRLCAQHWFQNEWTL